MTAPNLASLREYLGASANSKSDTELLAVLDVEMSAQSARCKVGLYAEPDLVEALYRRVAHNLAARAVPLGVSPEEMGLMYVGSSDPEVRRLEAPYRRLVVG